MTSLLRMAWKERPVHSLAVASLAWALLCGCDPAPRPASSRPSDASAPTCSPAIEGLHQALLQIDSMFVARLESDEIPGIAAAVICSGELIWDAAYGVTALDDPRPVTPQTRFRIASITKLFTATAVMKLQEAGLLSLTDAVSTHLAWFRIGRPPGEGEAPVTIWHLLTHTSGMPRDSRLTDFARLYQPGRDDAIQALPSQELESALGERYAYSNLGYGVLGELIAEVSGKTYAEYLVDEILKPMEMDATLVHPTPEDDTAWGHGPRRPDGLRLKAGFWDLGFATPAGGMASSTRDLSKFVILQLEPYVGRKPRLLPAETLREMHAVHYLVDPARGGSGVAWGVETSAGQHVVYHGGELPEQSSYMMIDVLGSIGIVVLTNAQDVDAAGLAQGALDIIRSAVERGRERSTDALRGPETQ